MHKINPGCGKRLISDTLNVDIVPLPGVDVVLNIDGKQLSFASGSVEWN